MFFIWVFYMIPVVVFSEKLFACNETSCNVNWIGDGTCDLVCNTAVCNFDSSDTSDRSLLAIFSNSDCYWSCIQSGCNATLLGNKKCDPSCNSNACGYDLGDCGYCSDGCFNTSLVNNKCESACNNTVCMFDNNACGWCAYGCYAENLTSSVCDPNCNVTNCLLVNSNPCIVECSTGCKPSMLGNNICNDACNNQQCGFDYGDCLCNTGCYPEMLTDSVCLTNSTYNDPCDNSWCNFKNGACGDCSEGCFKTMLGNGHCDELCNTAACNYDYGDCGCSYGCNSLYNSILDIWTWDEDPTHFSNCLVPSCLYNYGSSIFANNHFFVREIILAQIIAQNWSLTTLPDHPKCSDSNLKTFDQGSFCSGNDPCNNALGLYCVGMASPALPNCLRGDGTKCLICKGMMIMSVCVSGLNACPEGYSSTSNLGSIFDPNGSLIWCLREPTNYNPLNYKTIFLGPADYPGLAKGTGTNQDPYLSLYYAFTQVYAAYTQIILGTGNYHYEKIDIPTLTPLILDKLDPLNINSFLNFNELVISGSSSTDRSVVYWHSLLKITPNAQKLTFINIIFDGSQILAPNCYSETDPNYCFYCPLLFSNGGIVIDQNSNQLYSDEAALIPQSCNLYNTQILFGFNKIGLFENVDFTMFRQQFNALIFASGTLNLTNVNFQNLQPAKGGSVISMTCSSNCDSVDLIFVKGTVAYLNSGYQLDELLELGSFFTATSIHSAIFEAVKFTYNLVLSYLGSPNPANLISITRHTGTITISNCDFDTNYVDSLIVVDVSTLTYQDLKMNYLGYSVSYGQTHFSIIDTTINNIYSSTDLITYKMEKTVHNINFTNLVISNVAAGQNGIISILNSGILTQADISGIERLSLVDGNQYLVWIPPRFVNITGLTIKDSSSGLSALFIKTMPIITVLNTKISNVGDSVSDQNSVIDSFYNNDLYLSNYPGSSQVASLYCSDITSFLNLYSLGISGIEIDFTQCTQNLGTAGLNLNLIQNVQYIDNANLHDIDSTSPSGLALYVVKVSKITISYFDIQNVINHDGSVIEFLEPDTVNLENVALFECISENLSPVQLTQVLNVDINNFTISQSQSYYGNGGCLTITGSRLDYCSANIESVVFDNCAALNGYGGAFMLDSIASVNYWQINVNDMNITKSQAIDGGAIYITSQCSFHKQSTFSNLNIISNNATLSIISDNHNNGPLYLSNSLFLNNEASVVAISGLYTIYSDFLHLNNVEVYNCFGFYAFSISTQNSLSTVSFENVLIHDISYQNGYADAIDLTKITFSGDQIVIYNMNSAINVNSPSNVTISNSKFYQLAFTFYDSINGVQFVCDFCEVFNVSDSLITATSGCSVTLTNSVFHDNIVTGQNTALLNIYSNGPTTNTIQNCTFQNNIAVIADLISFTSTSAVVKDSRFVNNSSPIVLYTGFYLYETNILIENCVFRDQISSSYGAFLFVFKNSNVKVSFSTFTNGAAAYGGAIYIQSGSLVVDSSFFINNKGYISGGSIYASGVPVTIKNTTITQGSSPNGDAIYMDSNLLTIIASKFTHSFSLSQGTSSSIYLYGTCSLIIDSSYFESPFNNVSALIVTGASSISVSNSYFMNISGNTYGAVSFIGNNNNGSVIINNCQFTNNNSTGTGGAISLTDMSLSMANTLISKNIAGIDGGGLYLQSPQCHICTFNIRACFFTFNSCTQNGGALAWYNYKPNIDNSTIISNNSAAYGSDFASKPAALKPKVNRMLTQSTSELVFSNIAPGENITEFLLVYLVDTYGNIVVTDSSSTLTIQTIKSYPDLSLTGTTEFTAKKGVFNITGFIGNTLPGSTQFCNASTNIIPIKGVANDDTVYENTALIELNFRNCSLGEQIGLTSCVPCPELKFLIEPNYQCLKCPDGANCLGGFQVLPQPGYWRSSNMSAVFYPCPVSSACIGNTSLVDYQGSCATGYYGVKCAACLGGFTMSNKGVCDYCPDPVQNGFIFTGLIIFVIIVCILLVNSSLKSAFKSDSVISIYIKIFTNYIQLVFLTSQFNLQWPSYVLSIFSTNKQVAESSEAIFSVDCYVASRNSGNPVDSYFYKLILFSLLPIIVFFLSFLIWIGICLYQTTYRYLKRELPLTMIILFFLFYPNIVKIMFSHFACENIDQLGDYLMANFAIKCWDDRHLKYALIVALPSIVIWAFGLPSLVLSIMTKRRKYLSKTNNKVIFGFLYNGYRGTRFYWEFLIMYRKIAMIAIAVFALQVAVSVQALIIVILLIISVFLQYELKPFNSSELNHMELEALMTALLTLYCGLFYITNAIGTEFELALFLVIACGNLYFLIFWAYWIVMAAFDIIITIFPFLKYSLKKGDAFREEFYEEKIEKIGTFHDADQGEKMHTLLKHPHDYSCAQVPNNVDIVFLAALRIESKLDFNISDFEELNRQPNKYLYTTTETLESQK